MDLCSRLPTRIYPTERRSESHNDIVEWAVWFWNSGLIKSLNDIVLEPNQVWTQAVQDATQVTYAKWIWIVKIHFGKTYVNNHHEDCEHHELKIESWNQNWEEAHPPRSSQHSINGDASSTQLFSHEKGLILRDRANTQSTVTLVAPNSFLMISIYPKLMTELQTMRPLIIHHHFTAHVWPGLMCKSPWSHNHQWKWNWRWWTSGENVDKVNHDVSDQCADHQADDLQHQIGKDQIGEHWSATAKLATTVLKTRKSGESGGHNLQGWSALKFKRGQRIEAQPM